MKIQWNQKKTIPQESDSKYTTSEESIRIEVLQWFKLAKLGSRTIIDFKHDMRIQRCFENEVRKVFLGEIDTGLYTHDGELYSLSISGGELYLKYLGVITTRQISMVCIDNEKIYLTIQ